VKNKDIKASFERTLLRLLGYNILPKLKRLTSRDCPLHKDLREASTGGAAGDCPLNFQTKCTGKIQSCGNPDALKDHLAKQGLGWNGKKGDNYRCLGGQERGSVANGFSGSIVDHIDRLPKPLLILSAFIMSLLVGLLNLLTGSELPSSVVYLAPIALVTWFTKRWMGMLMSFFCALTWFVADFTSMTGYSGTYILYWNGMARFASFTIFTVIFAALRRLLDQEKESSRIDFLTGIRNRKCFIEVAEMEIKRAHRYNLPFCVVYIDLDDFKPINDYYGHNVGDSLLRLVAHTIQNNTRAIDTAARIGGDEFAILLPETGPEMAQVITQRIQRVNAEVMQHLKWRVTLSMGLAAFTQPPPTVDDLLKKSDALMYSAKKNGKNTICYGLNSGRDFSHDTGSESR